MKNLDNLTIHTTNHEVFTGGESAVLAFLIFKRFGRDVALSTSKWRDMLQNGSDESSFMELVTEGEKLYDKLVGK